LKIAIFGGTFDPIHNAHLIVAREAAALFGLDRILFVPAANPPHKRGETQAGYEDRFRMVELACQGVPEFQPSRLEEGQCASYSIHTIERVRAQLAPSDEVFFIIGADAFSEIRTWYRWQDVVRQVVFVVVTRPGHRYEVPEGAHILTLKTVALPVSSSYIRDRLGAGEAVAEVPPEVLEYIQARGLYRSP